MKLQMFISLICKSSIQTVSLVVGCIRVISPFLSDEQSVFHFKDTSLITEASASQNNTVSSSQALLARNVTHIHTHRDYDECHVVEHLMGFYVEYRPQYFNQVS